MSQLTVLPKLFYQHTKIFGHGPYLIKIEEDHVIKKEKNCLNSINVHHCNIGKNKSLIIPQNEDSILRYTHATPILKFIYSGKATKFCKISAVDLTATTQEKSTVEILQKFVTFSEYMNFITIKNKLTIEIYMYVVFAICTISYAYARMQTTTKRVHEVYTAF